METPVYLCGSHAIGTVLQAAIIASGRGPDNIVLPVVGECDDGDLADSRTVVAGDVEARSPISAPTCAEGTRRRRDGDELLRLPGRHRHRLARGSATITSACCCSATSATASTSTSSRGSTRRRPPVHTVGPARAARLLHRRLRDRRAALAPAAAPARAAPAARPRPRRLLRRRGLRRDRDRLRNGRRDRRGRALRRGDQPRLRGGVRGRPRVGLQLPGRCSPGAAARRHDAAARSRSGCSPAELQVARIGSAAGSGAGSAGGAPSNATMSFCLTSSQLASPPMIVIAAPISRISLSALTKA